MVFNHYMDEMMIYITKADPNELSPSDDLLVPLKTHAAEPRLFQPQKTRRLIRNLITKNLNQRDRTGIIWDFPLNSSSVTLLRRPIRN